MIFIYFITAFLLGVIFIQLIVPLIDGIINLILTQFEVWKGHMAVKITKYQQQTTNIENKNSSQAIGFTISKDEKGYYEDE